MFFSIFLNIFKFGSRIKCGMTEEKVDPASNAG